MGDMDLEHGVDFLNQHKKEIFDKFDVKDYYGVSEKKFLNDKYPGELNKFIFGSASEEYVNELFELYKKYKKTKSSNVEEFLKEF